EALNPFLSEGWELVNTSNLPDPESGFFNNHKIKPNITVYSNRKPSNDNLCRSCNMETFIEVKVDADCDGFDLDIDGLEKNTGLARDTRGQLVTYFNAMQASQYRTHGFGVLLFGRQCRLLRHTRSGIEVTTPFSYVSTNHPHLQNFFWQLSHASPALRGIDDTFEAAVNHQASDLLKARGQPLWRVRIGDRYFFVSTPFTRNHHYLVGRGTCCLVTVDCLTMELCILKDTWRVAGYHREGEVYHGKSVRNIAEILAEGDVAGSSHSCGSFDSNWEVPSGSTICEHIHYRIVLDVVGEPLSAFKSTWELNKMMLNAVESHHDAVIKAGVHHRDVSGGNIIIVRRHAPPVGYLIDWELSKYDKDDGQRVYEKTGTLQFMAARLLSRDPVARTVGDDLESFMLVYLWIAVLYASNDMSAIQRGQALEMFDSRNPVFRKLCISSGHLTPYNYHLRSTFLEDVLMPLMYDFSFRYSAPLPPKGKGRPEEHKQNAQKVETHAFMLQTLEECLKNEEWKAIADPAEEQKWTAPLLRDSRRKRKSDCTEYDDVFAKRKK
ncbi:hypothetical protein BT96DRAFT_744542, partial [Gymnopus androsaceus JB14]